MYNFEQRSATYSNCFIPKIDMKVVISSGYNPISFDCCHGQIDFLFRGRKLHVVMYSSNLD